MKGVAFTFDDDVSSHYEVVAPMFEKYGLNCTFFINGANHNFWNGLHGYEVPDMSNDQILDLYKRGFEIGNHTYDHIHIGSSQNNCIREQLMKTEDKLSKLGIEVSPVIAYPGYVIPRSFPGSRDKRQEIIDIFCEMGYKLARAGYFDEGLGYDHDLDNNPQKWERNSSHYYVPNETNPFLIKCCGLFCDNFTLDLFKTALEKAPKDSYCVFTGHVFSHFYEVEKLENICRFCIESEIPVLKFSELSL